MKRAFILLAVVALIVLSVAAPASANPIETIYNKFFGCDGMFQWPCPGPVLW